MRTNIFKKTAAAAMAAMGVMMAAPMTAHAESAAGLMTIINTYGLGGGSGTALSASVTNTNEVTVTGGDVTGATKTLELNINGDVTVKWGARLTGTADPLINLSGAGSFVVTDGLIESNSSQTIWITINGVSLTVSGGAVRNTRTAGAGTAAAIRAVKSTNIIINGTGRVEATGDGDAISTDGHVEVAANGLVSANAGSAIRATGTTTATIAVNGGTLKTTGENAHVIYILSSARDKTINVSGGTVTASGASACGILNVANTSPGAVTISGTGKILTVRRAIESSGGVVVNGGVISSADWGIFMPFDGSGNVAISDGVVAGRYSAVRNNGNGTVTISGGVVITWSGSGETFTKGASVEISETYPSGITATWVTNDGKHGMDYTNGSGISGFVEVPGVTVQGGLSVNSNFVAESNLKTAIEAALNTGGVTVTGTLDGMGSSLIVTVPENRTLIWNADLTMSGAYNVSFIGGTTIIRDGGKITGTRSGNAILFHQEGTVVVETGGSVVNNASGSPAVRIENIGSLTINGGTVTGGISAYHDANILYTSGTVTGNITASGDGVTGYYIGDNAAKFDAATFTPTNLFALDRGTLTANGTAHDGSTPTHYDVIAALSSDKLDLASAAVTASVGSPTVDKAARTVTFTQNTSGPINPTITISGAKITGTNITVPTFTMPAFGVNINKVLGGSVALTAPPYSPMAVGITFTANVSNLTPAANNGRPPLTYQWQYSENGYSGWNSITGANNQTYTVDLAYSNKWIRVVVGAESSSGFTGTVTTGELKIDKADISGSISITLQTDANNNGIAEDGDILSVDISGIIPAAAQSGVTYSWDNGVDPAVTTPTYTVTQDDEDDRRTITVTVTASASGDYVGSLSATIKAGVLIVPPTGLSDMAFAVALMFALFAISAVLWAYVFVARKE